MREQGAEQITAVLGPGICGQCYEVPASMAGEVEKAVPGRRFQTRQGTTGVELVDGDRAQLKALAVAARTVGGCPIEKPHR